MTSKAILFLGRDNYVLNITFYTYTKREELPGMDGCELTGQGQNSFLLPK